MKIGIVFGTNRKAATAEIVAWMSEHLGSLGHEVICEKPADFDRFDCDLYILGTAVYMFSAKRTGLPAFIREHSGRIGAGPTALFIVCGSDPLDAGEKGLKRVMKRLFLNREKYMASVARLLPTAPIGTAFFKGYQEPDDRAKVDFESQKDRVTEWCDSLLAATAPAGA